MLRANLGGLGIRGAAEHAREQGHLCCGDVRVHHDHCRRYGLRCRLGRWYRRSDAHTYDGTTLDGDVRRGGVPSAVHATALDGLEERLKSERGDDMMVYKNREPKWNAESQMYQLDFRGRASFRSSRPLP